MDEEFSDADKLINLLENQHCRNVVLYHKKTPIPTKSLFQKSR